MIRFGVDSILLLLLGFMSLIFFSMDVYFPLIFSVLLMGGAVAYFISLLLKKRIGPLLLILLLVFLLPFIHIPPYLWFDYASTPLIMWGVVSNPYMFDQEIVKLTAMIGATGALGMAFAVSLSRARIENGPSDSDLVNKAGYYQGVLLPIWLLWVLVGVALSWVSAPQDTIFTAAYTSSQSLHARVNFSSAWMMSYVILTFAFCDSLVDANSFRRKVKFRIICITALFVLLWFQLLRGERESISWIFALALVYFYWGKGLSKHSQYFRLPWFKITIIVFVLVAISMVVGTLRSTLVGSNFSAASGMAAQLLSGSSNLISNMINGTWSAVLLTPISVAGDYVNGLLQLKMGKDYSDLILSIPPGFVADALGYVRPLSASSGPAWEMRYGLGGTHAAVVPFMNFRMFGVLFIPAVWTFILLRYENSASKNISVPNLSLLATIAMASPHWLWYGDKNAINAFILWMVFSGLYKFSSKISRKYIYHPQKYVSSV